jgi:hypothetical protein
MVIFAVAFELDSNTPPIAFHSFATQ